ncbi:MAG: hypothetical protein AAF206_01335 [Bacteroidota bacterium]
MRRTENRFSDCIHALEDLPRPEMGMVAFGFIHFYYWWILRVHGTERAGENLSEAQELALRLLRLEKADPVKAKARLFKEFDSYVEAFQKLEIKEIRTIGYWSGEGPSNDHHPDAEDFIVDAPYPHQADVVAYLKKGTRMPHISLGFSICRICGISNGTQDLSDGKYMWPEGLAHYVEAHQLRLPAEFEKHVLSDWQPVDTENMWPGSYRIKTDWWDGMKKSPFKEKK